MISHHRIDISNTTTVFDMTSRDDATSRPVPSKRPQTTQQQHRLAAIDVTAGTLSDCFPPNYLKELRADWPG